MVDAIARFGLSCCLAMAAQVAAQTPKPVRLPVRLGGVDGYVHVLPSHDGMRVRWGAGQVRSYLRLDLEQAFCGVAAGSDLVLFGADALGEVVGIRVRAVEGELVVEEGRRCAGLAPQALAYDSASGDLFVLESDGDILCSPGGLLRPASELELVGSIGPDEPLAWRVFHSPAGGGAAVGNRWWVRSTEGWREQALPSPAGGDPVVVLRRGVTADGEPLQVRLGAEGLLVLETRGEPEPLPLGSLPAGDSVVPLPHGRRLDPAKEYRLSADFGDRSVDGDWFRPRWRAGRPFAVAPAEQPSPIDGLDRACTPGSGIFMVRGAFLPRESGRYTVTTWFAIGEPDVTEHGELRTLAPSAGIEVQVDATADRTSSYLIRFAVPDEPASVGQLLSFQAALRSPSGELCAITDVCGIAVGAPNPLNQRIGRDSWPGYLARHGVSELHVAGIVTAAAAAFGTR